MNDFTWFSSQRDGQDHAVLDVDFAEARARGLDYAGLCGHVVWPSPLWNPPGRRCPGCTAITVARSRRPAAEQPAEPERRSGWLRRLLRGGPSAA